MKGAKPISKSTRRVKPRKPRIVRISLKSKDLAQELGRTWERGDLVALTDHGISVKRIRKMYAVNKLLFDLPLAEKLKLEIAETGYGTGYHPFGYEKARGSNIEDLKEYFHLRELFPGYPYKLPLQIKAFKSTLTYLFNRLQKISEIIADALNEYLGLPRGYLKKMIRGSNHVFRVLNYPGVRGKVKALRAKKHADINFWTMSFRATRPGLQGFATKLGHFPIDYNWNEILLHVGQMLEIFTQGRLRALRHLVVNSKFRRMAAAFFTQPHRWVVLEKKRNGRMVIAGPWFDQAIEDLKAKAA